MDINHLKSLNKTQLLGLFNNKDLVNKNEKREFFSEVFYDFTHWPMISLRDFWLIRRISRMRITNFCFGNGLSLKVFIEMIEFYHENNADNQRRLGEMILLWERLKLKQVPDYYYYSIDFGFEIYFSGRKRVNGQPAGKVRMGRLFNTLEQNDENEYLSPAAYERNVRIEMAYHEQQRLMERQELIRRAEKKIKVQKALSYLKLKSVDDLFSDD